MRKTPWCQLLAALLLVCWCRPTVATEVIFTIDSANSFIQVVPGEIGPGGAPNAGTFVASRFIIGANGHMLNDNTSLMNQLTGIIKADLVGQTLTFSGGSLIDVLEHPDGPFPPTAEEAESPGVEDNFGGRILFDTPFIRSDFGAVVIRDAIADIRAGSVTLGSTSTNFDFELLSAYVDYQQNGEDDAESLDAATFEYESISTATLSGTGDELTKITVSFELTAPFAALSPDDIDSQLAISAQIVANLASEPGDFDRNGEVDGRDFLLWQRNPAIGNLVDWQANYPNESPGDFDADGDLDGRDFLAWQRNPSVGNLADWQANYGTGPISNSVAVPESVSILSGLWPFAYAILRRRQ